MARTINRRSLVAPLLGLLVGVPGLYSREAIQRTILTWQVLRQDSVDPTRDIDLSVREIALSLLLVELRTGGSHLTRQ